MKKFIAVITVILLTFAITPVVTAQDDNVISKTKEKTKSVFEDSKKGVSNLFSKAKDKLSGDKTDSDNKKKEKVNRSFKKKGTNMSYKASNKRTFTTKSQKYKDSNGNTIEFGFYVELWYDMEDKQIHKKYFIHREVYAIGKETIPAGNEILIRTANMEVGKALTQRAFSNDKDERYLRNNQTGSIYGTESSWSDVYVEWLLPNETVDYIIEYGVIKIRTDENDYVFEGKEFENAHKLMCDYLLSLEKDMQPEIDSWIKNPPKPKVANERPEF